MRIVLVKRYDGEWTYAPDLDKVPAIKNKNQMLSSNHLETLMRNMSGSINSYLVLDVSGNDEENMLKVVFPLISIKIWDDLLNEAMKIFIQQFSETPQTILMNQKTLDQVEKLLSPSSILIRVDDEMADQDFALVYFK